MSKEQAESRFLPVFFALDLVACSLLLTAYFVPFWFQSSSGGISYGLWFARSCLPSSCNDTWYIEKPSSMPVVPSWDLIRGFETTGVILAVISLFIGLAVCLSRDKAPSSKSIVQGMFFATALFAGLAALIGLLLFLAVETSAVSWAPGLVAVAAFLLMSSGVFTLVLCRYNPYLPTRRANSFTVEHTHF